MPPKTEKPMPDLPVDPQVILKHIQDGLLIVDKQGIVLWTNETFRSMIGRKNEELAGRQCTELGVGSFCDSHCPIGTDATSGCGNDAHFNVQVGSPDGEGEPGAYCFVTSSVRDDNGEVIGYMENFRGMDRVRDVILQLQEVNDAISAERQKTETLIDSLADGVFAVDSDLRIRRFSHNMEQMLGVDATEAIGKHCREVLGGTLCDTDCPLTWSLEHDGPVSGCKEELRTSDGRRIPVTITTGFLQNEPDFEKGLFGVVTDRSEVESLRRELSGRSVFHRMLGSTPVMGALFRQIEAVAPTDATVLILGESGTGKELVADAVHQESARANKPFVSVNCAAMTEELLESELFGHVRGAFTGAIKERRGRFLLAAGGTLFLDEVGDTSPALQAKLLRAIQEKIIEPVGSDRSHHVDVRIIAATNKNLLEEVAAGRFREDLYYRLNVIPIGLPPLRERSDDIPLLVHHFIRKHREVVFRGREDSFDGISERALALLTKYTWPGNVRELEHAIEYAMISSSSGRIERQFLPEPIRRHGTLAQADSGDDLTAIAHPPETAQGGAAPSDEVEEIRAALEANHWHVGRTAGALGMSRTTLWRRMKHHGIERS